MAAAVIGFTNYEGDGIYGVEAYYNDYLAGVDGKIISATDGLGNEMPYKTTRSMRQRTAAPFISRSTQPSSITARESWQTVLSRITLITVPAP